MSNIWQQVVDIAKRVNGEAVGYPPRMKYA